MPLSWDAPIGAGGSGRHRWTAPQGGGGGGGGGSWGGSEGETPNERFTRERFEQQSGQDQAQANTQANMRLGADLSRENALALEAAKAKYAVGLQNKKDWNAGLAADKAAWDAGAADRSHIQNVQNALQTADWFKTHAGNLEGVIAASKAQGQLATPEAEDTFRRGFHSQNPDFMSHFGPVFDTYAQQQSMQKKGLPPDTPAGTAPPAPQSWSSGASALLHPSTYLNAGKEAIMAIPRATQWIGQTAIPNAVNPFIPEPDQKLPVGQ